MKVPPRKTLREISDYAQIEEILRQGVALHLAMSRDDQPYLVPLNYVYADGCIYLHTGPKGLKMDFLRANPKVCFSVCLDVAPAPGEAPCKWNCHYRSVVGFGRVRELDDEQERRQALLAIVGRYVGPGQHELIPESLARTAVLRLEIEHMTGKRNLPEPVGA